MDRLDDVDSDGEPVAAAPISKRQAKRMKRLDAKPVRAGTCPCPSNGRVRLVAACWRTHTWYMHVHTTRHLLCTAECCTSSGSVWRCFRATQKLSSACLFGPPVYPHIHVMASRKGCCRCWLKLEKLAAQPRSLI